MELTVQNVYGLLIRSKLLPLDEARALYERWQRESGDSTSNLEQFSRWIVSNRYLTEYQAKLLIRGQADSFFLNQYKILERIGKGRMAGVYKAAHELGQVVAIKVLPPSRARDPQLLARFQREARLALRLKHPNIVRSFQVGKGGDLNYLVMEYLEGETLDEVMQRRGKFPPAEAVRLVHQALQGLQHIHDQGLVHRDLKPSNLMLVPAPPEGDSTLQCTVKILDIGLARALFDEEGGGAKGQPEGLTTEGVLLGTPDYMAPEQARDPRTADIRADIYSLGCVLYHLLAGRPPFPDKNLISQMIRHATESARPLKDFNPAVPDGLQQIVNWMLAKDPGQRYPTPERAAQALQVFLAAGGEALATPEADPKMKPFLTWVETENSKAELDLPATDSRPSGGSIPVAQPVKAATATANARAVTPGTGQAPADKVRHKGRHKSAPGKRRSKKHKRAAATSAAVPVPAPSAAIDVELVPAPAPVTKPALQPGSVLGLGGRDLVMFGLGVLGTLVAVLLAAWLAGKFSHKERTPPAENPPAATARE